MALCLSPEAQQMQDNSADVLPIDEALLLTRNTDELCGRNVHDFIAGSAFATDFDIDQSPFCSPHPLVSAPHCQQPSFQVPVGVRTPSRACEPVRGRYGASPTVEIPGTLGGVNLHAQFAGNCSHHGHCRHRERHSLRVTGAVRQELQLTIRDLLRLPSSTVVVCAASI